MSKVKSLLLAAVATCGLASAANAAVLVTTTSVGPADFIVTATDKTLASGDIAITVSLTFVDSTVTGINAGGTINGVANSGSGFFSNGTANAFKAFPLFDDVGTAVPAANTATLDDWQYPAEQGTFRDAGATTPNTAADAAEDSHILYVVGQTPPGDSANNFPGISPTQTTAQLVNAPGFIKSNSTSGAQLNRLVLSGGLTKTMAFNSSALTQPFAQLIEGSSWTGPINFSIQDLHNNVINGTISPVTGVPEPASLGVLALGGAALLARRKKA